jgi:hypothetical protein
LYDTAMTPKFLWATQRPCFARKWGLFGNRRKPKTPFGSFWTVSTVGSLLG